MLVMSERLRGETDTSQYWVSTSALAEGPEDQQWPEADGKPLGHQLRHSSEYSAPALLASAVVKDPPSATAVVRVSTQITIAILWISALPTRPGGDGSS